jgi:hypothetical protein
VGDTFDGDADEGVLDKFSVDEGFLFKMGRDDDGGGCLVDERGGDEDTDDGTDEFFKRADWSPSTFQDRARDLAASSACARRICSSFAADSCDSFIAMERL